MQAKLSSILQTNGMSRRNALKMLAVSSAVLAAPTLKAQGKIANCQLTYNKAINYLGLHQAGVLTPEPKNATFIAFNTTANSVEQLQTFLLY